MAAGGRRRKVSVPVVAAVVVAVAVLEAWVLVQVGHAIGGLATVLVLVAEGFLGAWLLRREGSRSWRALRETLQSGRMPTTELVDGVLVLVGGILLMLPGFVTDVAGLVFLLPFTRPLARRAVLAVAGRQLGGLQQEFDLAQARARVPGSGQTIEGEVVPDAPNTGSTRARRDDGGDPPAISGTVL